MNRRRLLAGAAGLATVLGAGCPETLPVGDGTPTPDYPGTVPWTGTPPAWTRDASCSGMADSVVRVETAVDSLGDAYAPVRFADLTAGEQEIAWTVLRDGGYATCDPSAAFDRFAARVGDHYAAQNDGVDGPGTVYLAYRGRFYGLYVETEDVIVSG